MKKIWMFVLLIGLLFDSVNAQDFNVERFSEFLDCFPEEQKSKIKLESGVKISQDLLQDIFGRNYFEDQEPNIYAIEKYVGNNYISVILEHILPVGEDFTKYYLVEFSKHGEVGNFLNIGYSSLDLDGGISCELHILKDSVVRVTKSEIMTSSNEEDSVYSRRFDFYLIEDGEFLRVNNPSGEYLRKYDIASYKLLEYDYLSGLSFEELDIMRNEIFADHGYIFKTQRWKDYFSDKCWYIPRYGDVTDKLTVVEKINIENILKVSSQK
jgi:hypothetical protein